MNKTPQNIPGHLASFIGKVALKDQLIEHDLNPSELINQQYIESMPSMTKGLFKIICNRCGNQTRSLFGKIDCKRCDRTHSYCKKCIQMGRVLECTPLYKWIGPQFTYPPQMNACNWDGTLTNAQQQAANRATQSVIEHSNLLIWGVCGAGKTEMLFPAITKAIELGERICLATPRSDVVRELTPRFQEVFPNISLQSLYAGSENVFEGAQLTLSTTHQLIHYYHTFDTMIIDEVDAFPYHGDDMLPFVTHRSVKKKSTTIYLTATPRKEDVTDMRNGKLPFVFVPRRYHGVDLPVPTFQLSFNLQSSLQIGKLPPSFYQWLQQRTKKERQLLIFVPTISLAEKILSHTQEVLVKEKAALIEERVSFVHAKDDTRKEKVHKFREKQLDVLITTAILERGVTFPAIDVAIIDAGHEVFDEAALVQIAGRAGRSKHDPFGEVVFFHDGKSRAMVQAKKSIIKMNKMK